MVSNALLRNQSFIEAFTLFLFPIPSWPTLMNLRLAGATPPLSPPSPPNLCLSVSRWVWVAPLRRAFTTSTPSRIARQSRAEGKTTAYLRKGRGKRLAGWQLALGVDSLYIFYISILYNRTSDVHVTPWTKVMCITITNIRNIELKTSVYHKRFRNNAKCQFTGS